MLKATQCLEGKRRISALKSFGLLFLLQFSFLISDGFPDHVFGRSLLWEFSKEFNLPFAKTITLFPAELQLCQFQHLLILSIATTSVSGIKGFTINTYFC